MAKEIIPYALIAILAIALSVVTKKYKQEQRDSALKTEVIAAYGLVIHEMWIQDSTHFNETIVPTEAFQRADSVVEGFWEDVFFDW